MKKLIKFFEKENLIKKHEIIDYKIRRKSY